MYLEKPAQLEQWHLRDLTKMNFIKFLITLSLIQSQILLAASPVIWGPVSRGQNLQNGFYMATPGQKIDYDGAINYIYNGHGEVDATGWAAYADAAGTTPVDCTGGSPTETITQSSSSPLLNSGSLILTKDASNRQGQGASYAFTVDSGSISNVMNLYFYGTSGGSYATGDIGIYLYDITGTTVLSPNRISVPSGSGWFQATFSTVANTSYRLCIHTSTTNASAWTYKFDGVGVTPFVQTSRYQKRTLSSPITTNTTISDWTFSNLVIGRVYRASFNGPGTLAASDVFTRIAITHNAVVIAQSDQGNGGSGTPSCTWASSVIFTAAATSVTFVSSSFTAGDQIDSGEFSFAILQELPFYAVTTVF